MGLLDALSGGLTTATNAATAQQQGQLQGGQLAMALMMRQQQMAKERADMEQALAHAALYRHQNLAPVLSEPGYNEAKAGEAGAVANAQVQPHVDQAVQTAQGEAPIKVKTAGDIAQAEVAPHVDQATQISHGTVADRESVRRAGVQAGLDAWNQKQQSPNSPLTVREGMATQHLPRMAEAYRIIEQYGNPTMMQQTLKKYGGSIGNMMQSTEGQQLMRAIKQAQVSGALMSEGPRGAAGIQQKAFADAYTPQAWDRPETFQAVLKAMRGLMQSGKTIAGRGYERMDPTQRAEVESVINGAGATSATPSGSVRAKYGITPTIP